MPFVNHVMAFGMAPSLASATVGGGVTGLTALGTTATDALQLSGSWNTISGGAGSSGVIVPGTTAGFGGIRNDSGQTIVIYPGTGKTVNAAAASVTLATAKTMFFFWTSATTLATLTGA